MNSNKSLAIKLDLSLNSLFTSKAVYANMIAQKEKKRKARGERQLNCSFFPIVRFQVRT